MANISGLMKSLSEMKLDESKRKIFLVYGALILAAFAAYVMFLLKPAVANLCRAIPRMKVLKSDIKAVTDELPFKQNLLRKQAEQAKNLILYEKKLSKEKELPVLLESISKMARSSNVKILGITPLSELRKASGRSAGAKSDIYQEVPIRIMAQSGYHELGQFITKLENDERYMQVTDLRIKTNSSSSKRHLVQFVVYAYTFTSGN